MTKNSMIFIPRGISKLYKVLPAVYRRKLIVAFISVLAMSCVDLVGIGVLLPVLLLVLNEGGITANPYMHQAYVWLGFTDPIHFIYLICLIIIMVSVFRMLFTTYMQYTQNKRLFQISSYLSEYLYQLYYTRGFLFIKQHNSHQLINKINAVSSHLIRSYFVPFATLISELIVITSILAGLILFNVYVFLLVLLTFVPIAMIYYRVSRKRIKYFGELLYSLAPQKGKLLQQTFVGYSDMEISNSFPLSLHRYRDLLQQENIVSSKQLIWIASLQRVLEIAVVCSIVVLIIATQVFQLPALGIIVGMFAIAIYRVLPGIVKVTSYLFQMRGSSFALNLLDEISQKENESFRLDQKEITFHKAVRFDSVDFSYDKEKRVISNLSLEIKKGDFVGLKGESGSGKSTLFHLFLGFLKPDSGIIYVDETPLSAEMMTSWHAKIGYVSQQLFMIEGSLLDNIVMGQGDKPDRARAHYAIKLASLDKFVASLPQGLDTPVGEGGCLMSGGQRQRLGIARALYKEAEILMFDEATSSLDEATEKAINRAILHLAEQRKDLTLLVISHRAESLAVCREVIDLSMMQSNENV